MAKRWRKKFNGARLRPGSRSLERAKAGESVATPQPPMGLAGSDALPSACPDQRPLRPCPAPPGGDRAPALIASHPAGRPALHSLHGPPARPQGAAGPPADGDKPGRAIGAVGGESGSVHISQTIAFSSSASPARPRTGTSRTGQSSRWAERQPGAQPRSKGAGPPPAAGAGRRAAGLWSTTAP